MIQYTGSVPGLPYQPTAPAPQPSAPVTGQNTYVADRLALNPMATPATTEQPPSKWPGILRAAGVFGGPALALGGLGALLGGTTGLAIGLGAGALAGVGLFLYMLHKLKG